jgi:quinolinate synthase
MANVRQVDRCWEQLASVTDTSKIVPITYVNSTAAIKAFVGRNGGACCTSSNARKVIEWALERGEKLLFLPDQHLGRNTCVALGLDPDKDMMVWDPRLPLGGATAEELREKRILLWKGHCSVHARFTTEQIAQARVDYPNVTVIVHPECELSVVRAADKSGSTEFILKTITEAPAGTVWAVGTEINLVNRLSQEQKEKTIFCLDPVVCPCSTMYRIHPHYLLWTLESLGRCEVVNPVKVEEAVAVEARIALKRMLEIC